MVVSAIWDLPHVQFLFIYFKELLNETTLWDSENTDYKFFFFLKPWGKTLLLESLNFVLSSNCEQYQNLETGLETLD